MQFRSLIPWLSVFGVTFLLAGCGESIEKNKLFKDQQKTVARLDDETRAQSRQLEDIQATLTNLVQDVREVKNTPGGSVKLSTETEGRLREIQDAVTHVVSKVSDLEGRVKGIKSASATTTARPAQAEEDAPVVSQPAPRPAKNTASAAQPTNSGNKSKAQIRITRATGAKLVSNTAPAVARGTYYTVKKGDTAESIASSYKIGVRDLMAANGVPRGKVANFASGQKVYIPAH